MIELLEGDKFVRKTNHNLKQTEFGKKSIISFSIVQIVILIFFLWGIYEAKPINISDCTQDLIYVEDTEYSPAYGEYKFYIYSNETQYEFANLGVSGDYTGKELYDEIQPGEILNIIHVKGYGIFGNYNLIVDARNDDTVYLDVEMYNFQKEKAFISIFVIFAIIEILYLSILILSIVLNYKGIKVVLRKKHLK